MSEDYLVRNCAPTLAGLKTANLFTCPIESREATMESILYQAIVGGFIMSEDYLVRNCAPTLAGLKTANLFTCPIESREATMESIRSLNRHLSSKGLRIIPLRFSEQSALIYLYRPQKLSEDLRHGIAVKLLPLSSPKTVRRFATRHCRQTSSGARI